MSYRYFSLTKVLYFGCVLKLCDIPLTPIFCIWLKWRGQRLRAFAGLFSKMARGEKNRQRKGMKYGGGCRKVTKRLRAAENEAAVAAGRTGSRLALWLVFHRGSIFKDSFICLILREFVSVLFEGVCLCLIICICIYIYICFVFHPCLSEVIFPVLYDISVSVVSNLLFGICLFNCLRLPIKAARSLK